jgi:hypothetical protein
MFTTREHARAHQYRYRDKQSNGIATARRLQKEGIEEGMGHLFGAIGRPTASGGLLGAAALRE